MFFEIKLKTDADSQELASDAMWTAGASGVEIKDADDVRDVLRDPMNWDYVDDSVVSDDGYVEVKGIFTDCSASDAEKAVREALSAYPSLSFFDFGVSGGADDDWENGWKKFHKPVSAGDYELVPVWLKDEYESNGGTLIYINPATAFGTGEHASTRLALKLMSGETASKKVIDIGTGSGVLGIAAAKSGAKSVLMTDFDPEAVSAAKDSAELNGVADFTEIRLGNLAEGISEKADLLLANLTADILLRLLPAVRAVSEPTAKLVLSGILNSRAEEVLNAYSAEGAELEERADEGEWTAFKMRLKPRAAVFNLGCKTNQYECDVLSAKLYDKGFSVTESLGYADCYFINTCAVTAEAERKSRQIISRCLKRNPAANVYILGCAAEKNPAFYMSKGVKYLSGTGGKYLSADAVNEAGQKSVFYPKTEFEEPELLPLSTRTRALVKIEDGCDNFCSYCVIPYLRGRARSRGVADAANEINRLSAFTREIVVTGINLSAFGRERGESLAELMRAVADTDVRLRLGSFYAEGVDEELLEALKALKKFCPHFHLSLQSGSDRVLKAMNRRYTAEKYLDKITLIRKYFPLASVTTDIIVGFPGETEADFSDTLSLADKAAFSDIHIFPFSAREGTAAYRMKKVADSVKVEREKRLRTKRDELRREYLEKMSNVPQNVLFETSEDGFRTGYSEYYVKFYVETDTEYGIINPTALYKDGLKGEPIK